MSEITQREVRNITSQDNSAAAITRRTLARIAAGGLLAAVLPVHASGKLNIGIGTYSYHNLSMDDMIVQLNALASCGDRNVPGRVHADEPSQR